MNVVLDAQRKWKSREYDRFKISYIGFEPDFHRLRRCILDYAISGNKDQLSRYLNELNIGWSLVVEYGDGIFAAVDQIRSHPLFYFYDENFLASNSARVLKDLLDCSVNNEALLDFRLSGYATGSSTVFNEIKQLQAGECLCLNQSNSSSLELHRYYRYLPQPEYGRSLSSWVSELGEVTEEIFSRLVEYADGREILVPLSGGLDSRLIVTMLRHLGYENVRTFSYGSNGNYEAKIAKNVAARVGYPWEFILNSHHSFREFFWSDERKSFTEFADNLCSIPSLLDISSLSVLYKNSNIRDSIVVNGQSGDFISGGHISESMIHSSDRKQLLGSITSKHFSLRKSLLSEANLVNLHVRINENLDEIESNSEERLTNAVLYESWEWQERQCKYVVNGQRGYDFFGINWRLPLWDKKYLEFWKKVPFELKIGQRLYKEFLQSKDYCNLFKNYEPVVWHWPGATLAVLPAAKLVGLIAGNKAKEKFYSYARYIGHYGPNYAPWGLRKFLKDASDIRNPVTNYVDQWLIENNLPD